MSKRVDFSGNASVYDQRHGAALPDEGLRRLWEASGLQTGVRLLDIGAGTGRVAIPLVRHGCSVVATDAAVGMLTQLRAKASGTAVPVVVAEGARLPFPAHHFDAVLIARLLYLTPDWRAILDETCRVLRVGGRLLHEWSNGQADEHWVQIREEARRLFEQAGVRAPFHPGARAEADVDRAVVSLGLVRETQLDLGPGPTLTLRTFLRRLAEGELSYIWNVPEDVRTECLPRLQRWAEQRFDLERPIPMPRELGWTIYRKDAV